MMGDGYIPNVSFILDAIIDFTCFCFMLFLFIMIMYLEWRFDFRSYPVERIILGQSNKF